MKVPAIYLRVSTLHQTTGLQAQERAILEYCKAKGITDYVIYSDEGVSGAKANRPGLDKLMSDVRNGSISHVIVYSFSRFARSLRHLLMALDLFRELKVDFVSVTESLDTSTAVGRTIFSIIASIAELERELIRERVVNGLKNAKASGKKLGAKKTINSELVRELGKQKLSQRKIASLMGVSKTSVQRELAGQLTDSVLNSGPVTSQVLKDRTDIQNKLEKS